MSVRRDTRSVRRIGLRDVGSLPPVCTSCLFSWSWLNCTNLNVQCVSHGTCQLDRAPFSPKRHKHTLRVLTQRVIANGSDVESSITKRALKFSESIRALSKLP